jgi:hypothetical protein
MRLKTSGTSRAFAAVALLAAALGCNTDSSKSPSSQLASPVTPLAGNAISISASRSILQVGQDEVFSVITVQALRASDFTPLPDGTDVLFSSNLGAFDTAAGGRGVTVDLIGGKASVSLYPGTAAGTARVTATINGAVAQTSVTIREDPTDGIPPEPAPVQSTLTLVALPGTVSVEDSQNDALPTTDVLVEGTVFGSDGKPFRGAGVYFTSSNGIGTFSSGTATSAIFKTNSQGKVSDILAITDAELASFPGSSFTIVGHLGVVGGERTSSVSVAVIAGPAPAEAAKITLQADKSFVDDDGTGETIALNALVQDQFGDPFEGGNVVFKSTLGSPSPTLDVSDGSGVATSSLVLTSGQITAHPTNSFSLTAELTTSTGTVISSPPIVITIVRPGEPAEADNVTLTTSESFVLNDGTGEVIDLDALVQDQFGAPFLGGQVTFTSTLGTPSPTLDASDGAGLAESTLTLTNADITNHGSNSFTVTATLTTPDGPDTSSVVITIVRPPQADFTFSGSSGSFVVTFDDLSTGTPTSWSWDFDSTGVPGVNVSSLQDPTFDFTALAGGTYIVELTVSNGAGSDSVTKAVTVPLP